MVESLISTCVFRTLLHRKKPIKFHSYEGGVLHLALCCSRVDIASLDMDCSSGGIKVLVLDFSDLAAVHGVGVFCTELFHVELHHSASYFLVGSESDLYVSVLEFRMFHDILNGIHYLGDTGLVIRSEKGSAVRGDDGLALVVEKFREFRRF